MFTKDEINEMARQAGIIAVHTEGDGHWYQQFVALEAFAKLVDAKATAREREACASICDELHWPWHMGENSGPKECAEAIRARGTNE
jgi:hypothetical protein